MYWFDTTILALLVIGLLLGVWCGFVGQLARIVCMGVSIYGSVLLHEPITQFLQECALQDANLVVIRIAAYFLVFAASYLILHFIMRLARIAVREADLDMFDRLLGGALGGAKMALVLGAVCLGMANFHHPATEEIMARSTLAEKFADNMEHIVVLVPEEYKSYLRERIEAFSQKELMLKKEQGPAERGT